MHGVPPLLYLYFTTFLFKSERMVRLATLSATALLGCGALLMTGARGEEAIPPESCETTDYSSFPEDEVGGEIRRLITCVLLYVLASCA